MRIERTDQGELDKIVAAPQEQGVATPLRSASVSGGQTRFNGTSSLIVNGSEDVYGTLNVQGTLNADGTVNLTTTINITGTLTQSGSSTFTGPETHSGDLTYIGTEHHTGDETHNGTLGYTGQETHIGEESHQGNITNIGKTTQQGDYEGTGHFKQTGDEEHTGNMSIKGNMQVDSPGVLKVGAGLTLEPFPAGGGQIAFNPTGSIGSIAGQFLIIPPDLSTAVTMGSGGVGVSKVSGAGGTLRVAGDVYLTGLPDKP